MPFSGPALRVQEGHRLQDFPSSQRTRGIARLRISCRQLKIRAVRHQRACSFGNIQKEPRVQKLSKIVPYFLSFRKYLKPGLKDKI